MIEIEKIRSMFPVTRNLVYLNNAAVAPLPLAATDAINEYLADIRDYGSVHDSRWLKEIEGVREHCASIMNADPSEIAFLKNPLSAISVVVKGVGLKEKSNVVTADVEFPANVYPWMSMVPKGVEVKFVGARGGRIQPEDVDKSIDSRTRILAISLVEFGSGYQCAIEELKDICRRRGVYFFLDASHGLGSVPFDVRECGADFVMVGAHKWLLGLRGTGIFFCRNEMIEKMECDASSWRSFAGEGDCSGARPDAGRDARRFEAERPSFPNVLGLGGSLRLREKFGNPMICTRIRMLADRLMDSLEQSGYVVKSPLQPRERSGIVAFSHPTIDAKEISAKLKKAGIIVTARNNVIRASPHFYNSEDEIDLLLSELPR